MSITESRLTTKSTDTQIFIEALLREKVEVIFGSPSGTYIELMNAFEKCESLKHVFLHHEQATVHAADGYARATGKTGVVFISSQSGMTNAITGIATAGMDSVPLVVFVYQERLNDDACQVDTNGTTLPIVKFHYQIHEAAEIQNTVKDAFLLAETGRPGPVIVELCMEWRNSEGIPHFEARLEEKKALKKEKSFSNKLIDQVLNEINSAQKPIIFIGGGVTISGSAQLVAQLAEKAQIPVVSSLMGIGSIPGNHPLYLGMVGMHGTFAANRAVHRSDLLICLGVRFSDRVTGKISGFSPKSKKIHIDIDPAEINKVVQVDIPIVGDVKDFLVEINQEKFAGDTLALVV